MNQINSEQIVSQMNDWKSDLWSLAFPSMYCNFLIKQYFIKGSSSCQIETVFFWITGFVYILKATCSVNNPYSTATMSWSPDSTPQVNLKWLYMQLNRLLFIINTWKPILIQYKIKQTPDLLWRLLSMENWYFL